MGEILEGMNRVINYPQFEANALSSKASTISYYDGMIKRKEDEIADIEKEYQEKLNFLKSFEIEILEYKTDTTPTVSFSFNFGGNTNAKSDSNAGESYTSGGDLITAYKIQFGKYLLYKPWSDGIFINGKKSTLNVPNKLPISKPEKIEVDYEDFKSMKNFEWFYKIIEEIVNFEERMLKFHIDECIKNDITSIKELVSNSSDNIQILEDFRKYLNTAKCLKNDDEINYKRIYSLKSEIKNLNEQKDNKVAEIDKKLKEEKDFRDNFVSTIKEFQEITGVSTSINILEQMEKAGNISKNKDGGKAE